MQVSAPIEVENAIQEIRVKCGVFQTVSKYEKNV